MKTNCSHKLCIILWVERLASARRAKRWNGFLLQRWRCIDYSCCRGWAGTFYFTVSALRCHRKAVLHACCHNIIILIKFIKMMMARYSFKRFLSVRPINQIHTQSGIEMERERSTLHIWLIRIMQVAELIIHAEWGIVQGPSSLFPPKKHFFSCVVKLTLDILSNRQFSKIPGSPNFSERQISKFNPPHFS